LVAYRVFLIPSAGEEAIASLAAQAFLSRTYDLKAEPVDWESNSWLSCR